MYIVYETSRQCISCMKRVASPGSMHGTGCLGLVHWDDPEGGYGEGGGRRVQDGEHGSSVSETDKSKANISSGTSFETATRCTLDLKSQKDN